jgi:hypothetical protein
MADSASIPALIIATISAGVATLSLVISYRTYRKQGAVIKMRLSLHREGVALNVENSGAAEIHRFDGAIGRYLRFDWRHRWYRVRKRGGLPTPFRLGYFPGEVDGAQGPRVPYTLKGNHSVQWIIPRGFIAPTSSSRRIMAEITLGSGKKVTSRGKWGKMRYPHRPYKEFNPDLGAEIQRAGDTCAAGERFLAA